MITRMAGWLGVIGCLMALSGCGETTAIEVRLEPTDKEDVSHLVIASKVDDVQLKDFSINRGNCKGYFFEKGRHLKFGDTSTVYTNCRIVDIQKASVETDQGTNNFTF